MKYYFILGKNPQLSKAEIEAVLANYELRIMNSEFFDKVLIVDLEKELDIEEINKELGGTVKIGQVIDQIKDLEKFEDRFLDLIKVSDKKMHFGFSLYALAENVHLNKYKDKLRSVAMEIKRKLREEKHQSSRWVVSKDIELSSVIVKKNKLLKYGAEICLFIEQDKIIVGQTLAVQLFEEFGARDYNRPGRDDVSGMIPPKLAKIMLNLAQIKDKKAVVLDPFCGSGTILQEGLLMGYENLIGFDNSEKAVDDSRRNLEWIKQKYASSASADYPSRHLRVTASAEVKVKKVDVRDLSKELDKNSIDAIITEPYLGPPLKGNESEQQINKNIKELEKLYLAAFEQFKKVLSKKGKVVIVIPEFRFKNKRKKLDLSKINGFKVLNKEYLEYSRPDQHLIRNIMIWQKI